MVSSLPRLPVLTPRAVVNNGVNDLLVNLKEKAKDFKRGTDNVVVFLSPPSP